MARETKIFLILELYNYNLFQIMGIKGVESQPFQSFSFFFFLLSSLFSFFFPPSHQMFSQNQNLAKLPIL
jgi:hypothetical protein